MLSHFRHIDIQLGCFFANSVLGPIVSLENKSSSMLASFCALQQIFLLEECVFFCINFILLCSQGVLPGFAAEI